MKTKLHNIFAIILACSLALVGPVYHGTASPIMLAPLAYVEQKVAAADGLPWDGFGVSVAISGNTALVGASASTGLGGVGHAYVYIRQGTTWELQQKLAAPDGNNKDGFGISVALSGDTALVGSNLGSAYIFTRSGATWTQQAKLVVSDGAAASLGNSVALAGDTALVGVYGAQVGANIFQGAAYVFTRSGTDWSLQQTLSASDGEAMDGFGFSVALSGDTALVGAHKDNIVSNSDQGSAYVFTRSGPVWTEQAKLTAADGAASDWFGTSVALSGNTALVGAINADVGPNLMQGAAYVFTYSGTSWAQEAKLTASDGKIIDFFGNSVAILGNTAIVGAEYADVGSNTDQGLAYVFSRSGTSWVEGAPLAASDGAKNDWFGASVALSADTVLVGAFGASIGGTISQGAAYFYEELLPLKTYLPVVIKNTP